MCADSASPPDTQCSESCFPEVIAVDLSNQDVLITTITNMTENCPIEFSMRDTCFPKRQCTFSGNENQLLPVSLKDKCIQWSSFRTSTFTLNVTSENCFIEIEISSQCETGIQYLGMHNHVY